jgi:hypothetical protein
MVFNSIRDVERYLIGLGCSREQINRHLKGLALCRERREQYPTLHAHSVAGIGSEYVRHQQERPRPPKRTLPRIRVVPG